MASQDPEAVEDARQELELQQSLSDKLQLLHLLSSSPIKINRDLSVGDAIEGRILDAIAVCLQGSMPGDVTAATLDRRRGLTVVLMKNRPLQDYDRQAAHDFFNLLRQPLTPVDVLRFIMTTSTANLNKVKGKVASSQAIDILRQKIQDYEPSSLRSEFKVSEEFEALISERFETTDAKRVLLLSLDRLQQRLVQDFQVPISDDEVVEFHRLSNTAKLFNSSIFFTSVISKISPDRVLNKFQRRIEKFLRYDKAALSIVTFRDRFSPWDGTTISHRWVEMWGDDCRLPEVSISTSPVQVAVRSFPSMVDTNHALRSSNPDIFNRWLSRIQPSYHTELLLVCKMHSEDVQWDSKDSGLQTRMIGCSEISCPCCYVALRAYNTVHSTRWQTTRVDGRSYGDWSVLNVPWLDNAVQKWVDSELALILRRFLPSARTGLRRKGKRKRSERSEP